MSTSDKAPPHVGKAVQDAIDRGAPNVDLSLLPNLTDLSPESITENVIAINSLCPNLRQKFVFEKLVRYLHDFVREVGLTTEEWLQTVDFLTATGKISSDIRKEFILLSDIFGLSALVDTMNHPKPTLPHDQLQPTEATVLGPFFTEDSHDIPLGDSIASEGKGEYMFVEGRVMDLNGTGIPDVVIETWETDADGFYDTQYADRTEPDCRGRLRTDKDGKYAYRGVKPVAYPIPNDGPVGKLLRSLNRHVFRPAHLHMTFEAEGYEPLTTALYIEGDVDAVFGVKSSLVVSLEVISDPVKAKSLGFKDTSAPYYLLQRDYVLITKEQAEIEKMKSLKNYYASLQPSK